VYGLNSSIPFKESDTTEQPVSLYAATKKANETMPHSYAHVHGIPISGLRFFTVYGPWGRPDMALFKFTKNILDDKPIDVYNYGNMLRDFTYVDDIVEGIYGLLNNCNGKTPTAGGPPYAIYNIGNSKPVNLLDFIRAIEEVVGKKAILNLLPLQPGDVTTTYAAMDKLRNATGYAPTTTLQEGTRQFVLWYMQHYQKVLSLEQV
jgi:UDP-glucuronate 4-epimerase